METRESCRTTTRYVSLPAETAEELKQYAQRNNIDSFSDVVRTACRQLLRQEPESLTKCSQTDVR